MLKHVFSASPPAHQHQTHPVLIAPQAASPVPYFQQEILAVLVMSTSTWPQTMFACPVLMDSMATVLLALNVQQTAIYATTLINVHSVQVDFSSIMVHAYKNVQQAILQRTIPEPACNASRTVN